MAMWNNEHALLLCLRSQKPRRLIKAVRERLKKASRQLSTQRPGVIWFHLLGLNAEEFLWLAEQASSSSNAFTGWANYVLGSPERGHVIKLRLSGQSDGVRVSGTPDARSFEAGGPAYDLTSRVSRFSEAIAYAAF